MILFILVSIITFSIFADELYYFTKFNVKEKLRTLLLFLPLFISLIIYYLILLYNKSSVNSLSFNSASLYSYFLLRWDFIPVIILASWTSLVFFIKPKKFNLNLESLISVSIIYFSIITFFDIIAAWAQYDGAIIFIAPLLRLVYLSVFILILEFYFKSQSLIKFVLASLTVIACSLVFPLFSLLYYKGFLASAYCLSIFIFLIMMFVFTFLNRKKLNLI